MVNLHFLCAQEPVNNIDKLYDTLISLHDNNIQDLSSMHDKQMIIYRKNSRMVRKRVF